jgi:uncharacterized PurR-regulated membrane protein YhhQ (DUF165 family)
MNLAIASYILALVIANLLVSRFGFAAVVFNAVVLIGLDLTLRDWLHVRLTRTQMLALVGVAGLLTYVLNPAAGGIAIASAVAFTCAALADWAVFSAMHSAHPVTRSVGSNIAGAAVDSVIFPAMAFGGVPVGIVLTMFACKVVGSTVWSFVLLRKPRALA